MHLFPSSLPKIIRYFMDKRRDGQVGHSVQLEIYALYLLEILAMPINLFCRAFNMLTYTAVVAIKGICWRMKLYKWNYIKSFRNCISVLNIHFISVSAYQYFLRFSNIIFSTNATLSSYAA